MSDLQLSLINAIFAISKEIGRSVSEMLRGTPCCDFYLCSTGVGIRFIKQYLKTTFSMKLTNYVYHGAATGLEYLCTDSSKRKVNTILLYYSKFRINLLT